MLSQKISFHSLEHKKADSSMSSLFMPSFTCRTSLKEEYFRECGMNISIDSYNRTGGKCVSLPFQGAIIFPL